MRAVRSGDGSVTGRFGGVVRLEPRRLLGFEEIDEGDLVLGDGSFTFKGRRGQLVGHGVREVSTTGPGPGPNRVYEIKYGEDPIDPSKALFKVSSSAGLGSKLREGIRAALAVDEVDPLLVALNELLPSVSLSLAQFELIRFPSQCVCCLAPAADARRCLDATGEDRYGFVLRLAASRVMEYTVPALNVPYCEAHLLGFDACMEIQRSWKTILESAFWRRWNEAELADSRLQESRPYVNPQSAPRFGPASDSHTRCWLGLRLDWMLSDAGQSAWDKEESVVSIVLRFQHPAYTALFLAGNRAS